jgi:hypothetical protein
VASEAERGELFELQPRHAVEEALAGAQDDRGDVQGGLVDQAGGQVHRGPNMLRPIMNAPALLSAAISAAFSSGVSNIQRCSWSTSSSPKGLSAVWWGPAAYPSAETAMAAVTRGTAAPLDVAVVTASSTVATGGPAPGVPHRRASSGPA